MQIHRLALSVTLLTTAAILVACATSQDAGETGSVGTYDELVAALRDNGSAVESLEPISQPFFEPEGRVIRVDGSEVQVFEYPNEEDAQLAAGTISSDGSSVGTTMISWVEAPHFFKSGSLIALYVGEEDAVVKALEAVLGPQLAGR